MTQEKQRLLKDLSSRLPYGVKVLDNSHKDYGASKVINIGIDGSILVDNEINDIQYYPIIDDIKPYLRSLSSMTDEEFEKLKEYSELKYEQLDLASFQNGTCKCLDFYLSEVPSYVVILVFDWLNIHYFDYRGLIERDLALEAPENMYK